MPASDDSAPRRPSLARRIARRLTRGAAKLALLSVAAFAGGFAAFVLTLPGAPPAAPEAEGIVVLTGGDERIDVALRLLEEKHAGRLLISGLHAATGRVALQRQHPTRSAAFDCCVDLGWAARDTPGNATEIARWARAHGYRSLIVVTASYHMPRALLELDAQLGDVTLIPYPVTPGAIAGPDAWRDPETVKLFAGEYMKYVAAQARIGGDKLLRLAGL